MIRAVEVENWKRHARFQHTFQPGLNFILGPNGRGKTSLLEAIHFSLFGGDDSLHKYSIRHDASTASARVELDDAAATAFVGRAIDSRGRVTELLETSTETRMRAETLDQFIERCLGADVLFLRQLAFLSEGDIYRYGEGSSPGLDRQMATLMPLGELVRLRREISTARSPLTKTQRKQRAQLQMSRDELARLSSERIQVEQELRQQTDIETGLQEKRSSLETALFRKRNRQEAVERHKMWRSEWGTFLGRLSWHETAQDEMSVAAALEEERRSVEAQIRVQTEARGRVNGRIESVRFFIASLEDSGENHCPLCRQDLSREHRTAALQEQGTELDHLAQEAERVSSELTQLIVQAGQAQQRLDECKSLLAQRVLPPDALDGEESVENELARLKQEQEAIRRRIAVLADRVGEIREKLAVGEADRRVEEEVVFAFRHDALLEIAEKSVIDFLEETRASIVTPLADELSRQWKAYRPDAEWGIGLDAQGLLCLVKGELRRPFSSLSGGEKAIAIVLFRLALARSLTNLDFLILDEPLEHLDARSRRLLVSALHNVVSKGIVKQIIMSTYEESLVRRLVDRPAVHALYLA